MQENIENGGFGAIGQNQLASQRPVRELGGQTWPPACLYLVATPIGNLADLTVRAWYLLQQCDAIAAEDTRTTGALLEAWGIRTPLLAAHRHNEQQAAQAIVARLARGERIALVSDAGAPAISDPGARIVRAVVAAGFRVVPLPGASALVAALMASGATSDEAPGFAFAGFPPSRAGARRKWLAHWLGWPVPVAMFEAPHRLLATVQDLIGLTDPARRLTIARELTKRFEEIHTLALGEACDWLQAERHRTQGEFVLIVHALAITEVAATSLDAAQQQVMRALLQALSLRDAVRIGVQATGLGRDQLYAWALARQATLTASDPER